VSGFCSCDKLASLSLVGIDKADSSSLGAVDTHCFQTEKSELAGPFLLEVKTESAVLQEEIEYFLSCLLSSFSPNGVLSHANQYTRPANIHILLNFDCLLLELSSYIKGILDEEKA